MVESLRPPHISSEFGMGPSHLPLGRRRWGQTQVPSLNSVKDKDKHKERVKDKKFPFGP